MSKTRVVSKTVVHRKTAIHKNDVVISGKLADLLHSRARLLGIAPEELAKRALEQFLKESADEGISPSDPRFQKVAEDMMRRYAELYKRLSK
jgi:hypothetical protein